MNPLYEDFSAAFIRPRENSEGGSGRCRNGDEHAMKPGQNVFRVFKPLRLGGGIVFLAVLPAAAVAADIGDVAPPPRVVRGMIYSKQSSELLASRPTSSSPTSMPTCPGKRRWLY